MRLLHVISGLGVGGTEKMLLRLIENAPPGVDHNVISLTNLEPVGRTLEKEGIPVQALGMRSIADVPRALRWVRHRIEENAPDVVQTWLYHADLVGGLAARGLRAPVVWNLRHSDLSSERNKRSTLLTARLCALLSSRLPARIISCSHTAAAVHTGVGYDDSRIEVIPNGFDTRVFRPERRFRVDVRRELGIAPNVSLTGTVSRYHPQKDPRTLLEAAGRVLRARPDAHLLIVGRGFTSTNAELMSLIARQGITERIHLLGPRKDIPRLDAALDAFLSASAGEGFPNALGEAMACGIPCVATDVGDSVELMGDTGLVVRPRNPGALAHAWTDLLDRDASELEEMGKQARRRVQELFSLEGVRDRYENTWQEVARERGV